MAFQPDFEEFKQLFESFDAVPVAQAILADDLTPVSAFHRIDSGEDGCLFESVIGGEQVGRYSFLASGPYQQISAFENSVTITVNGQQKTIESDNPLESLRELIQKIQVAPADSLPPFRGGAVGFASYDIVRYVEHLPNTPHDDREIPDLSFVFYDRILVFDHILKRLFIIVLVWTDKFDSPELAFADAKKRIDATVQQLERPVTTSASSVLPEHVEPIEYQSNLTQEQYCQAVEDCVEYIKAGDIFQVVLSQRLSVEAELDSFEIYRSLRALNPSPFMFFLRSGEVTLVGASPEIMCRVMDGQVTVRPLAGTRPRGKTEAADKALEQELLADQKERAEHTMLVDLGRNDVGKIATFGSVELVDPFSIERYSHVMHISSTVFGKLKEDLDAFDAMMACHPAGTVSGAPKVRAMEIIDEFEPHKRGPYAGAVGYIDHSAIWIPASHCEPL